MSEDLPFKHRRWVLLRSGDVLFGPEVPYFGDEWRTSAHVELLDDAGVPRCEFLTSGEVQDGVPHWMQTERTMNGGIDPQVVLQMVHDAAAVTGIHVEERGIVETFRPHLHRLRQEAVQLAAESWSRPATS